MTEQEEQQPSRRAAIVTVLILALALLGAIYMVNRLHQMSAVQDCVMAGRTNCAPVQTNR
jgi:hypothetical protein